MVISSGPGDVRQPQGVKVPKLGGTTGPLALAEGHLAGWITVRDPVPNGAAEAVSILLEPGLRSILFLIEDDSRAPPAVAKGVGANGE